MPRGLDPHRQPWNLLSFPKGDERGSTYITTLKQAAVIFGGVTLIGLALAITLGIYQLGKLHYARELSPLPRPLD